MKDQLYEAIEKSRQENQSNRLLSIHNAFCDIDNIIPFDNTAYLRMVSLMKKTLDCAKAIDKL